MAAANLTANRNDMLELSSGDSLPFVAAASAATYYRGSAVGLLIEGSSGVGYISKDFSGSSMVHFIGVNIRNMSFDSSSSGYLQQVALRRSGIFVFDLVSSSESAETATIAHLGKKVFFRSDHEVSLTPPSQLYPVYAGRIVGYNGMVGYTGMTSTQVAVEITDATREPAIHWNIWPFIADCAILNNNDLVVVDAYVPGRRAFISRMRLQCVIAASHTVVTSFKKNTADIVTDGAVTGTLGAITVHNINTMIDYDDSITIRMKSGSDVTAGLFQIQVEWLPIM